MNVHESLRSLIWHTRPARTGANGFQLVLPPGRFLSSDKLTSTPTHDKAAKPDKPREDTESGVEENPVEVGGEHQDGKPWYLQVEPPTRSPIHEPLPLPPLPDSPPALLEPLLRYIYEEMGLDDMELLDLRSLDPPAAIGSNLIMILGTARSERHLHVSCGRLCRWLRYRYKVETEADGLIGAAELKTKMRRLRRKAKLLGGSASAVVPMDDDGIRTGWVCLSMKTGDGGHVEEAHIDASGKLSGFGSSAMGHSGSTIVVQAMVESRREELDLEGLWREELATNLAEREEAEQPPTKADEAAMRAARSRPTSAKARMRKQRTLKRIASQRRTLSTFREVRDVMGDQPPLETTQPEENFLRTARRISKYQNGTEAPSGEECLRLLSTIFSPDATTNDAAAQVDPADEYVLIKGSFKSSMASTSWKGCKRT